MSFRKLRCCNDAWYLVQLVFFTLCEQRLLLQIKCVFSRLNVVFCYCGSQYDPVLRNSHLNMTMDTHHGTQMSLLGSIWTPLSPNDRTPVSAENQISSTTVILHGICELDLRTWCARSSELRRTACAWRSRESPAHNAFANSSRAHSSSSYSTLRTFRLLD